MPKPTPNAEDWKGWVWPIPIWNGRLPVISDGYQAVADAGHRAHPGVDITYVKTATDPQGLPWSSKTFSSQNPPPPVIAAFDGIIWEAGLSGRGYQVLIDHGKVNDNLGGVNTWYQHMEKLAKPWKKGDQVKKGDILGTMGHDIAPGAYELNHCHFELWFPRPGVPALLWKANPADYMRFWSKMPLPPQHLPTTKEPVS